MVSGGPENLITPVIVVVGHQRDKVERLRKYCWDLDHTSLICVEFENHTPVTHAGNAFHSQQAHSLHKAAEYMGGEPFIWLEPDSIPLRTGWVAALSHEYMKRGKKFMISSDHQRFDEVGGIGVYPPETSWLVPTDYEKSSWDLWLIEAVPHLVHRTPLIMHSYCRYGDDGFCKEEHRFPRDAAMLRPEAVIFHRDPNQDLLSLTDVSQGVIR